MDWYSSQFGILFITIPDRPPFNNANPVQHRHGWRPGHNYLFTEQKTGIVKSLKYMLYTIKQMKPA